MANKPEWKYQKDGIKIKSKVAQNAKSKGVDRDQDKRFAQNF